MKAFIALLLFVPGLTRADDWRTDLLESSGLGISEEELRNALKGEGLHHPGLAEAYRQLGSERYPDRQRAQKVILAAGPGALPWLRQQAPTDDPEVLMRLATIRRALELSSNDRHDRMITHAARTRLAELGKAPDPATGGIFYEWFGDPTPELGKRYRQFHFVAPPAMKSRIEDRALVHEGQRAGDDDQRLVLRSSSWPGTETFPDRFTITTTTGNTAGGSGAWHMGVSVGRVRALYHPGYRGGGFRFEKIDDNTHLSGNANMGFTPSADHSQQMRVSVLRRGKDSVRLTVTVTQEGSEPHEQTLEVPADTIGPLTEISLDRSGRSGGDARFAELMIELDTP